MKAITYDRYGSPDSCDIADLAVPKPGPDEVLIQVKSVGLNDYYWRLLHGTPFPVRFRQGLVQPRNRVLGSDIAGVIKTIGDKVQGFHPGDEVF